jgi:MinD-like ATPase involved in chromosome partitioning or flagellar assembly
MASTEKKLNLISIHSYKGGVGKSTVATLLGLALREKKVCLVDFDLVAPGLHHLLAVEEIPPSILDFLVVNPARPQKTPPASKVCRPITPGLPGGQEWEMYLIPGRPDHEKAEGIQSYLLADIPSGLLQARLELLLQEVQKAWGIEVFVLDTPPSLFGASTVVRALVEEHHGVLVSVSTPTWQDLSGSLDMLYHVEAARLRQWEILKELGGEGEEPEEEPLAAQAFVLNRWIWPMDRDPRGMVQEAILKAQGQREKSMLVGQRLEKYVVALIPESEPLARMSRIPFADELRPSLPEVLDESLCQLARTLLQRMEGGSPG